MHACAGPHLDPFTEDLVTEMVKRLDGVKLIPTHYHTAKGQSTFVLDSFPWLGDVLDGALFYYIGGCDATGLSEFETQIMQFDASLAVASKQKQLHVGLYFSHMGGCDNNGTTVPPAAFAYDSLDLVLELATNGSTKALHGGHVYTFEIPTGPSPCRTSIPQDKGCIVRELFSMF
jgi:hypothetical protein